jgi:hypothetical protein
LFKAPKPKQFLFIVVVVAYTKEPNLFDVAVDTLDLKQADSWIVDSGATKHVIGNCELFNALDQTSGSNTIEAISG